VSRGADLSWEWIDDDAHLREFVAHAVGCDAYHIDTEFHRERTYFPQLALVQIEAGGRLVLIDPLACDARHLIPLFEGPGLAVLHAAQQDLDVLDQSIGAIPGRIFDTQLAACFIGYSTPSLASLTQTIVGVTVAKGDRLTDWLRRPLTAPQLRYAASDVAHLAEIRSSVQTELESLGRTEWAMEACEELRSRPTGPVEPLEAWLRVKDVRTLRGRARWVARSVARWREERAMELDRPPRYVLSDIALLGVAQKAPSTAEDLGQCRGVDSGFARGSQGRALLGAVRDGLEESSSGDLQFPAPEGEDLEKGMRSAATLVSAWVTELARQQRLDATLLATRRDIVDLLTHSPSSRLATGWRAEIVGRDIEDLVAGRKALTFTGKGSDEGLRLVNVPGGGQ